MELPNNKYNIIYADPPWKYRDKALCRGGAIRHYETMFLEDICRLPVARIAKDDSILFLWATWPMLYESGLVIESWGFEYKTCGFVWVKTNRRNNVNQRSFLPEDSFDNFWGMGRWTRANSEFCLIATKGNPQRRSKAVHQIVYAPTLNHSRKPDEVRDRIIELVGDLPRIELFARQKRDGWEAWGDEI